MEIKLKEMGARVREARLNLKLSQVDLAEKAQLHPTYVSQIENGKPFHITYRPILSELSSLHLPDIMSLNITDCLSECFRSSMQMVWV